MGRIHGWMIISLSAISLLPACKRPGAGSFADTEQNKVPGAPAAAGEQIVAPLRPGQEQDKPTAPIGVAMNVGGTSVDDCPDHNCGTNSARVNGSVLGAVPIGGDQPNTNGFLIEPTLYPRKGSADPALALAVRDGQIVGVNDKGEVAAMGDDLQGRWFRLVRRYDGTAETRGKIRIVDVARVRLIAERGQAPDPRNPEAIAGYELKYESESGSEDATALCREAPLLWPNVVANLFVKKATEVRQLPQTVVEKAKAARRKTTETLRSIRELPQMMEEKAKTAARRKVKEALRMIRKLPRRAIDTVRHEITLDKSASWIFALMDEEYDEVDATIRSKPGALTLACPGTGLSKMKLMGYDPQEQVYPTTLPQRQAAIKMLTSRYCGAFPFTEDGKPLYWQNRNRWFSWQPDGTVEALWNENGAICLNLPRDSIYTRKGVVSSYCKNLPLCSESVSWENLAEGAELISVTPR